MGHIVFSFQWCLSQTINGFDDVKFEAASVLAELFEQQGQPTHSKPILRKAIELSQHSVYWHCRLIFQLAVSMIHLILNSRFFFYFIHSINVYLTELLIVSDISVPDNVCYSYFATL